LRHDRQHSFAFRTRDFGRDNGKYADIFRVDKLKCAEDLRDVDFKNKEKIGRELRVIKTKTGKWYLCVPHIVTELKEQSLSIHDRFHKVAACDPGGRTFNTVADADGRAFEWGKDDDKRIFELCKKADALQSKIDLKINDYKNTIRGRTEIPKKERRKVKRSIRQTRKAMLRIFERVRNLVNEVHEKLSLFLCQNYKVTYIFFLKKYEVFQLFAKQISKFYFCLYVNIPLFFPKQFL
jgi:putative transposase